MTPIEIGRKIAREYDATALRHTGIVEAIAAAIEAERAVTANALSKALADTVLLPDESFDQQASKMPVDLKSEWDRCSETYGGEPTPEQWYFWCLEILRGERKPQKRDR
jgi:hypothetical protein